ncbi:LURP-one-related/scramblase family protein [Actinoplanes sp. GCM10030250]|uniref:LURP-one-related/scramblase family protein n=1 Tax=Actinoplanes sp. GCM10030250 TaxID=3273376 RepID=UPI003620C823
MGLGERRARRREERETFGYGGTARVYLMREKLLSIGDDFWIEDEEGRRVFKVDGKALRLRKTFHLEDLHGERLCTIQKRVMHIRDTMEIEGPDGARIAIVHKAMISPLRERWKIDVEDGPDLRAQGNIVDHEYEIEADDRKIAQVSKRWFRVRDTYGVEMAPDQDPALLLAVTVAIDDMSH